MHPGSPAPCQFRLASPADAPEVHRLFAEYLASLGLTPDAELDEDMLAFPAAYTAPGDTFLLATRADGELLGMGGIRRGELRRVFVRAPQRGHGVARHLVLRLLQAASATGRTEFHGVIARHNDAIREVDLACGLLPTERTHAHPKQRDCEILALTRPPDLARPGMVIAGGSPAQWQDLLRRFAPQFNVLLVWHESVAATVQAVCAQTALGHWVGAIRCDVTHAVRLPFLAEVAHTIAGPCHVLVALPGADVSLAELCRAFAPQLAAQPGARVVRLVGSHDHAEPGTLHDLATGEPFPE